MTRQERIDCAAVAIGLAVLLFLFGMLAAPQPAAAPTLLPDAVAVASVTDSSGSEPSGVAGLTVGELQRDAWTAYQVIPETAPSGPYTAVPEYSASYGSTPPAYPADYFSIPSSNYPGVFHVFHMIAAQRA